MHKPHPLPEEALAWLRDGMPTREELSLRMGGSRIGLDFRIALAAYEAREEWVRHIGYGMPCAEAITMLAQAPLVEIGAGTGFWSALIRNAGGDIVATDRIANGRPNRYGQLIGRYHPIIQMNGARAVSRHPERDVLCVWPSYMERWAAHALKRVKPGRCVHMVGEGWGGATGNDWMFRLLQEQFIEMQDMPLPRWRGINDHLTTYIRKQP